MGFFSDFFGTRKPTFEDKTRAAVEHLRDRVAALIGVADSMDAVAGLSGEEGLGFSLRFDLLNFSLHMAASDEVLEPEEVAAINFFLGTNMSYADCKTAIEHFGLGGAAFNREVPVSFMILTTVFAQGSRAEAKEMAEGIVSTYKMLGQVLAMIDGNVDPRERRDLDAYLEMLRVYTKSL